MPSLPSRPSALTRLLLVILLLLTGLAPGAAAQPDGRIGPALARRLARSPGETVVAWVFFTDRSGAERDPARLDGLRGAWPARSLERRRLRGTLRDVDVTDLPVHPAYVRALESRGLGVRGTSRWLNAASVEGPAKLVAAMAALPFVQRVDLVPLGRRPEPLPEAVPSGVGAESLGGSGGLPITNVVPGETAFYGGTHRQLSMMQVPALHQKGLTGSGVLVTLLDSGFRTTHRALAGLDVVARRDFIHLDDNVDDEPGQDPAGAGGHGTATLGCVAAVLPGLYSGGAFNASVALGKTEDVASETPVEMDYWQFGAEWADSLGADVISSSLGYTEFDSAGDSYVYADMDGRTTVVALAAAEAARRGITVVTAAGNAGAQPWHFIVSPGDADSILTVGAVDSFNVVTSFSSRGPTSDGRIKPDVTAMGRSVLLISFNTDSTYSRASGTSLSTPLTAGVVALLLEAHPAWGPYEVREALCSTALNHVAPNNDIGWGLVQGDLAYGWLPSTVSVPTAEGSGPFALAVSPNPAMADGAVTVRFTLPEAAECRLRTLDLAGRAIAARELSRGAGAHSLRLPLARENGARLTAGVYWIQLDVRTPAGTQTTSRRLVVAS